MGRNVIVATVFRKLQPQTLFFFHFVLTHEYELIEEDRWPSTEVTFSYFSPIIPYNERFGCMTSI